MPQNSALNMKLTELFVFKKKKKHQCLVWEKYTQLQMHKR